LEDFIINRFGNKLYRTFFKDYTEKVWGVECHKISKEWGAQRIKGLSITKVLLNAMQSAFKSNKKGGDIYQKNKETSLIEKFLYPKFGPGQLWETVAETIVKQGGTSAQFLKADGSLDSRSFGTLTGTESFTNKTINGLTEIISDSVVLLVFVTLPIVTSSSSSSSSLTISSALKQSAKNEKPIIVAGKPVQKVVAPANKSVALGITEKTSGFAETGSINTSDYNLAINSSLT
jgi:hypothetical protein